MEETDELSALIAESLDDESTPALDDNSTTALREAALRFRELVDRKSSLESESKLLGKQIAELNADLRERLEALGSTSIRLDGVGLLYLQTDAYPNIHDPNALVDWVDEHGLSHLAKRGIHASTLRSWWKEALESGAEMPPPEIADAALIKNVRMRRS